MSGEERCLAGTRGVTCFAGKGPVSKRIMATLTGEHVRAAAAIAEGVLSEAEAFEHDANTRRVALVGPIWMVARYCHGQPDCVAFLPGHAFDVDGSA